MSFSPYHFGRLLCCLFCLFALALPQPLARAGVMALGDFSVGEEREVGEQLLTIVRREFKLLDDPDIVQYIRGLGGSMVETAGPRFFDYHFFVINSREVNAFAAPSGLIFFHSGLIELMDNENEFVGVIAHEVGHVASRHFASRLEKTAKTNIASMAVLLAGIAMGGGPVSEALIAGSMAAGVSMQLQFSRQDEEESDRRAFKWMQEQGRDPAAMVGMLGELRRMERIRGGTIPPYLLTHPEPGKRMGYVQEMLLFSAKGSYRPVDEFPFQRLKKRLMALTGSPESLMPYYRTRIATAQADDPETAMARYGLALLYQATADFDQAEAEMRRVIAIHPDRPMLQVDLGVIFFEAGRYDEALPLFRAVAEKEPENGYAGFYLARTLEQLGQRREAEALYEKLLPLLPDYPKLFYRLGNIKAGEGKSSESYYYLGNFYWLEGDMALARRHLSQAVTEAGETDPQTRAKAEELLERIKRIEKNMK